MALLTLLALALTLSGLAWSSVYSTSIYVAARGKEVPRYEIAKESTLSIVVPARGEPIELLSRTLVHNSRSCEGKGEVIAVLDDPIQRVKRLLVALESAGYPRNLVVIARLNGSGGRNGAMNDGARIARSDLVMVVDSDVLVSKEVVEEATMCPDVCVAPWKSYAVFDTRVEQATRFATDLGTWVFYVLKWRVGLFVYPLGAGTAIRRSVLESIGFWRTDVVQDDMWLGVELAHRGIAPRLLNSFVRVTTPPTLEAAAVQLSRWCYGSIDVLKRFGRRVVRSPLPLLQKLEALMYIAQPLQSLVAFAGLLLGVVACILNGSQSLFDPQYLACFLVFAASSAAYSMIAKDFARSWGEKLFEEKTPFLMGRYSAITATLLPILAASTLSALLGLRYRYRVTPKSVESKSVPRIAIFASLLWVGCTILALCFGNQPLAMLYLAMVCAGLYCCLRLRGGG